MNEKFFLKISLSSYQENGDDESEKSDGRSEDFDDQDPNEEGRVGGVRQSSSGSNLKSRSFYFYNKNLYGKLEVIF